MLLRQIFDPWLAQYAYLIGCPKSGEALVIDPERDIEQYEELARANDLRITAVAETHIHADFVSGAREFAEDSGMRLFLSGEGGVDWEYRWPAGRGNTSFLRDGDRFKVGNIEIEALHTPGHTPEHFSFLITDGGAGVGEPLALVSGDFLFVGDVGRPDLLESAAGMKGVMKESAETLRESLAGRVAGLEGFVQVLPAHGAGRMWRGAGACEIPLSRFACARDGSGRTKFSYSCAAKLAGGGALTGVLFGMFGVGGGFLIAPTLLVVLAAPVELVMATSLVAIFLISASGLAANLHAAGPFPFPIAGCFLLGGILGVFLGSSWKQLLSRTVLARIFAAIAVLAGTYILLRAMIG